jgi:peptidoglycan/xylan/chitin deacetylase (PgdA/CDA1 family)
VTSTSHRTAVLMYHRVGEGRGPGPAARDIYALPPARFEEHLGALAGVSVVSLEVAAAARRGGPLPQRSVVLTFDDGHDSDHHVVLPALRARGLTATFFIVPAWIGCPGYLSWDEVRELLGGGMSVGAHGYDHTLLGGLDESAVRFQFREARRLMEARLGFAPSLLSLPGGSGGPRVVTLAQEEGFSLVATSAPRPWSAAGSAVPRFALRRGDSARTLRALVEQRPLPLLRRFLRHGAAQSVRSTLGEGLYRTVRQAWARSVFS